MAKEKYCCYCRLVVFFDDIGLRNRSRRRVVRPRLRCCAPVHEVRGVKQHFSKSLSGVGFPCATLAHGRLGVKLADLGVAAARPPYFPLVRLALCCDFVYFVCELEFALRDF